MARFAAFLILLSGAVLYSQPIPPSKSTTDAITAAGTAAAANREAYTEACRALADDFGVKLSITITPRGAPAAKAPHVDVAPGPLFPKGGK
jgi:hypothetical protein